MNVLAARQGARGEGAGSPASPTAPEGRRAAGPLVAVAAAAALLAALALVSASRLGGAGAPQLVADPGPLTRWGLLVVRVGYDVAAIGTVGTLVVAVLLLRPVGGRLGLDAGRLVRLASRWALAWSATGVLGTLLGLADAIGVPVWTVLAPDVLPLALELPGTRALLSSAWLAALVVVFTRWGRSPAGGALLLLVAGVALLPPLLTGHAAHGEDHAAAVTGLGVHVVAASVWVGGLLAVAAHLRRSPQALAAVLPRYSALALACFVAVGASGALVGWAALAGPGQLWSTPYGRLLLGKVAALVVLGGLGALHRRRTLAAAARHRPRAFLALAVVELLLMAGTAGLAVGLSRTEPPRSDHAAAAAVLPAPSVTAAGGHAGT